MKSILIIILTILLTVKTSAQIGTYQANVPAPGFYLGLGTGLESFSGVIGVTGDLRVTKNFFLRAGAGIGSWGGKLSVGIRNESRAGNSFG